MLVKFYIIWRTLNVRTFRSDINKRGLFVKFNLFLSCFSILSCTGFAGSKIMGLMQLGGAGAAPGMMQPPQQQQQHTSPPPPHHHQQPNHFTHMLATQNPNKLPHQQEHSHAVNSQVYSKSA